MTSMVEKIINSISDWYQTSSVKAFWQWWTGALLEWVPVEKRQTLFPNREQVYILPKEEDAELFLRKDDETVVMPEEDELVDKQWWHQLNHHIAAKDVISEVSYLLSEKEVLFKELAMPAAAASNMGAVLQYELDKYIPFPVDQVVFDFQILTAEEGAEKVPVLLAVAQKSLVEQIENDVVNKGVQLHAIDINVGNEEQPEAMGVNLLTEGLRVKRDWSQVKMNVALFAGMCVMAWFVMFNAKATKEGQIERLEAVTDDLREQARRSKRLETQLNESIAAANFLGNKKADTLSSVVLINELTRLIPKNSYLTRIILDDDKVEVVGQSDNANALVPILNRSTLWFEPSIVGQVMPDARTGKEKFTIKAALKPPEEASDET